MNHYQKLREQYRKHKWVAAHSQSRRKREFAAFIADALRVRIERIRQELVRE